jgi:hypothetical protein
MDDKNIDNKQILLEDIGESNSELVSARGGDTVVHETSHNLIYTIPESNIAAGDTLRTSLQDGYISPQLVPHVQQADAHPYPCITKNQPNEAQIRNVQKALRTRKQRLMCPYCRSQIWTSVHTEFSYCNLICCVGTLFIPWYIYKCVNRKDYNCLNAQHKCPNCDAILANYTAC